MRGIELEKGISCHADLLYAEQGQKQLAGCRVYKRSKAINPWANPKYGVFCSYYDYILQEYTCINCKIKSCKMKELYH